MTPAQSLLDLATAAGLVSASDRARLRSLVQVRARERRPVSAARLLLQAGFPAERVREVLARGAAAAAVACDGCGRAVPQGALPARTEAPCPGCGALLLGSAAFVAPPPDDVATIVVRGGAAPPPLGLDEATPGPAPDGGGEGPSGTTVQHPDVLPLPDDDPLPTAPFTDVLALPATPRGVLSEAETIVAFRALIERPRADLDAATPAAGAPAKAPARPPAWAPSPPPEEPGARVGPWRLGALLGEGGVGRVYRARHAETGVEGAVKVLLPEALEDAEYVLRFRREAEVARRIVHPNVVAVLDAGRDPATGREYIAYELVPGGSLQRVLARRGALPEPEALRLARDIAVALGIADAHRLVHRDVKPENILLAADGSAKLADLGLIRPLRDDATRLTEVGVVVGTPCYMAPEQALGDESLDVRADIYALGLVVWQLLTGKVPFEEDGTLPPLELMARHIDEDVPDVRLGNPRLSDATAALVRGMTTRDRDARYPSPAALVHDLDRVLGGTLPRGPKAAAAASADGRSAPARSRAAPDEAAAAPDHGGTHQAAPAAARGGPAALALGRADDPETVQPGAGSPATAGGGRSAALAAALVVGLFTLLAAAAAGGWLWFTRDG